MATTNDPRAEIENLFTEIDQTDWGPQERALVEQAVALSRQAGDEDLEYRAMMKLVDSTRQTDDTDGMMSAYAWCLAKHDSDPVRFPAVIDRSDLFDCLTWLTGSLVNSPVFSLAQSQALLDDMAARFQRENIGPCGVATARFWRAWKVGAIEEAKRWRDELLITPQDGYGLGEVTQLGVLARFAAEIGEEETAIKLADQITQEGLSSYEEPENALAATLVAKLRAGRLEDARDSHMRSYRLSRNDPHLIFVVADNLTFCAITGNEARGLAMVERHLPWLNHDPLNQLRHFDLLGAVAAVLESVNRAGYGDQLVRGADSPSLEKFFGPHDGPWTAAELAPAAWAAAGNLAQAFDTRNGNSYMSGRLAGIKALLDEHYDLPVVTEVFLPPANTSFRPNEAEDWLALTDVFQYANMPQEAIDAAGHVLADGDAGQRGLALEAIISAHIALGNAYAQSGDAAAAAEHIADAERLFPQRLQALRDSGNSAQADLEERLGLVILGLQTPQTMQLLEAEYARLQATPGPQLSDVEITLADALARQPEIDDPRITALLGAAVGHAVGAPRSQAAALQWLAVDQVQKGDLDGAYATAEEALAMDISDGYRANGLLYRARLLGDLGRYDEGVADADAATKIYAAYRAGRPIISSTMLAAALLRDDGRHEEELTRLRYALREAEQLELATTGIRYGLGKALLAAGHPQEAAETLWQVLKDEEAAGADPADRAETCQALGEAFEAAENYGNSVSMYGQAADLLVEADNPLDAANLLRRQGNILRAFEEYDDALTALSRAWDLVQGQAAPGLEVSVLEAWAFAKAGAGDASALADMDRAVAIVQADPNGPYTWKIADLTDSKGRVLMDLERWDEAVAAFLQAADGYAAAGETDDAARAEHFAAQALAGPLERPAEAVPIWQQALTHADVALADDKDVAELRDSIILKLAEALDKLGRNTDAANLRALLSKN